MSAAPSPRTVACPSCKGASIYAPSNPYRPFCSERCKNIDLGAWASESYRVEAAPTPPEGDDPGGLPPPPAHRRAPH